MLPCPPAPQPDLPGAMQPGPLSLLVPRSVLIASLDAGPLWPLPWGEAKELFPLGGKKITNGESSRGHGTHGLDVGVCGCPHEADVCQS